MATNFDFISNIPGLMAAKNTHSIYISVSKDLSKFLGCKSDNKLLGKTDYELPCKASESAIEFIAMDKKVISSGEKLLALCVQNYHFGWKLILSEVTPIKDGNKEIIVLLSQAIDLTNTSISHNYFFLQQMDTKLFGKKMKAVNYIMNSLHCPLPLTEKQQACLFFIIRGKTIKEIAKILKLSPSTIEDHVDAIKYKLNCQRKSDVIEKAINSGFLYYVPEHIQYNSLLRKIN